MCMFGVAAMFIPPTLFVAFHAVSTDLGKAVRVDDHLGMRSITVAVGRNRRKTWNDAGVPEP
jgi:hypothetical protein